MKYILLFFLPFFLTAQVNYSFPTNQNAYEGGMEALYKDLHDGLIKDSIKVCSNADEVYRMKVLVDENANVKFVHEFDTQYVESNFCAFEIAKKSLKYLTKWNAPEVNGKKVKALFEFYFSPSDLINNFSPGYKAENFLTSASFKNRGIKEFQQQFSKCFDFGDFEFTEIEFTVNFEINTKGEIQFIFIEPDYGNKSFTNMILGCLETKEKWEPGKYRNTPVITKIKLPIKATITKN
ncbi:hypothetical protein [uncultured Chryseobacterium sp.]|uniref:hypothetical protein n=1 Tax=uncultured Chryseobacterium sp. TaxID=259322 RepID=UPI00261F90AE|nr:hypothetical protein [uncultured Chryseobacterium sp.]